MSIFARISDIFKANVNDALDKAEDPEKMIKQMVIEMEEAINKTTLAVAQAIANEKSLERKIETSRLQSKDWEQKAMQALSASREDLARAALDKKNVSQKNADDLASAYQQAKVTADKLREQLQVLKGKLEEARVRQSTLIARSQAAKAQKEIAQAASGVGTSAFANFEKYEMKIEKLEAEAVAYEELGDTSSSLEAEFKKLSTNTNTDQDLLELKRKMGLLSE
ncbi:MAG: PspA/IM30 family protein [bacterium]